MDFNLHDSTNQSRIGMCLTSFASTLFYSMYLLSDLGQRYLYIWVIIALYIDFNILLYIHVNILLYIFVVFSTNSACLNPVYFANFWMVMFILICKIIQMKSNQMVVNFFESIPFCLYCSNILHLSDLMIGWMKTQLKKVGYIFLFHSKGFIVQTI